MKGAECAKENYRHLRGFFYRMHRSVVLMRFIMAVRKKSKASTWERHGENRMLVKRPFTVYTKLCSGLFVNRLTTHLKRSFHPSSTAILSFYPSLVLLPSYVYILSSPLSLSLSSSFDLSLRSHFISIFLSPTFFSYLILSPPLFSLSPFLTLNLPNHLNNSIAQI